MIDTIDFLRNLNPSHLRVFICVRFQLKRIARIFSIDEDGNAIERCKSCVGLFRNLMHQPFVYENVECKQHRIIISLAAQLGYEIKQRTEFLFSSSHFHTF